MEPKQFNHVAVCLQHYILVFAGSKLINDRGNYDRQSLHVIWTYNLCTDQWQKHMVLGIAPPPVCVTCAVAVGVEVYLFGGYLASSKPSNELWKLTRTSEGLFKWWKLNATDSLKEPAPRQGHTGWQYKDKMWIFGGHVLRLEGYLYENGDLIHFCTNQILCFEPLAKEWTNPKCFGSIPTPRMYHATTVAGNTAWFFGGVSMEQIPFMWHGELYELNMDSLTWTEIHSGQLAPQERYNCTLNAINYNKLVLHGGIGSGDTWTLGDTWIFDLQSQEWTQYELTKNNPHKTDSHTGTTGLNNCVIVIGGLVRINKTTYTYTATFPIMLEPKLLQQLAMTTLYRNKSLLSERLLPKSLMTLLGSSVIEEESSTLP